MSRKRHPELEGYRYAPLYTFELKSRRKTLRNRLLWTLTGLSMGVGLAISAYVSIPAVQQWLATEKVQKLTADDPFNLGSAQAMSAAELTQKAEYQEDWSQVALLWQQAVNQMQLVDKTHPKFEIAQQKVAEYRRNLKYAHSNLATRAFRNPQQQSYWTLGSDRDLVLKVQGSPERVVQYDASCRENLYYGDSIVKLKNGYVIEYSDRIGNLKVLTGQKSAFSISANPQTWTIGASEEEVFQAQGTPSRTLTYNDSITLYYGDSSVELYQGRVIGYLNLGNNLKVSTQVATPENGNPLPQTWSLGSSRADVIAVENQPPTSVKRDDASCEEIFTFGDSIVTFRNGLVFEYSNPNRLLKVQ
jgi:hypothetical protein